MVSGTDTSWSWTRMTSHSIQSSETRDMFQCMSVWAALEFVCILQTISRICLVFPTTIKNKMQNKVNKSYRHQIMNKGTREKEEIFCLLTGCPDSDSLLVCQLLHLHCDEYYVLLMTPTISDKPSFVGLSPQFSFTGEGGWKGACIVLFCSLGSDCWHVHYNMKPLNISHWSRSAGLYSPRSGENMYFGTLDMLHLSLQRELYRCQMCSYKIINHQIIQSESKDLMSFGCFFPFGKYRRALFGF